MSNTQLLTCTNHGKVSAPADKSHLLPRNGGAAVLYRVFQPAYRDADAQ
ncbi:hypothetical protein J2W17_002507 [Pseudomonas lini]|nr:hypothetical protein [Pseudomonas lini]